MPKPTPRGAVLQHGKGPMKKKRILVACKIFEEEINYVLQKERESLDVEMVWMDVGLRSDPALP